MNKAFIFPGQGSQMVGMGKDFYDAFTVAKETFQEIDETLKFNLSTIIFNGPEEELTKTVNTQPALMAVSMAIVNTIFAQSNKNISELCNVVAGHSLGEYSALCASGSISLADTARLLQIRGHSMQEACPSGVGSMAACIGIEIEVLESIINNCVDSGICQIANDNIVGQIVISGHNENIDRVIAVLKDGGFKAIKLKVSAPFHCALMKPAEIPMNEALNNTKISTPLVPIIANVTVKKTLSPEIIKTNLITQICNRVRWRETIDELASIGIRDIIEIGSGKILTNMIKKSGHEFKTLNVGNLAELDDFMKLIS